MKFISSLIIIGAFIVTGKTWGTTPVACQDAHRRAVATCGSHEHGLSADTLSIVSPETRQRVAADEKRKLEAIKHNCEKVQNLCAITCDEEMETASLDGEDLTRPLEALTDCRQGEIAQQLRTMRQKIAELQRVAEGRATAGGTASNGSRPHSGALSTRKK